MSTFIGYLLIGALLWRFAKDRARALQAECDLQKLQRLSSRRRPSLRRSSPR
jgi:hypothetical protein